MLPLTDTGQSQDLTRASPNDQSVVATEVVPADAVVVESPAPVLRPVRRGHIPELDGLRALALWSMLGAHLFFTTPTTPAATAFLPGPIASFIEHGWLSIDLFFVLSGFLITGILLETKSRGPAAYFKRFYIRRAARILPLYFVVLAVLVVVYGAQYRPFFTLCALMAANLAPIFNAPIPDGAGPFWSLGVEEQFYLVWPWLVLWLSRKWVAYVAIAVIVVEPIVRMGASSSDIQYVWMRADGLAMGAFLATWFSTWDGDRRRAKGLILTLIGLEVAVTVLGIPFGILHKSDLSSGFRITQAVLIFGTFVATAVAFSGERFLGVLRSKILMVTALLSYCLYLVHKPLADGIGAGLARLSWYAALSPTAELFIRITCVLAVAYGIAAISRRFFELPFIKLGQRF